MANARRASALLAAIEATLVGDDTAAARTSRDHLQIETHASCQKWYDYADCQLHKLLTRADDAIPRERARV